MKNIQQEVLNGNINPYNLLDFWNEYPLSTEDIESLGWNQIEYDSFQIGSFILELNNEYKSFIYLEKDKDNVFVGTIKNKSELKKLMQMLNII
jgi:hypothetical protein